MSELIIVLAETTLIIQEQAVGTLTIAAPGPQGIQGPQGEQGNPGAGVPMGGTSAQLLAKASGTDFDTHWVNPLSAGSDYEVPLSFNSPLFRSSNAISFLFNTNNSWSGNNTFSGKLVLPVGSNPTVDTAGQIAHDTTDDQLIGYNGAVKVFAQPKKAFTYVMELPTAADTVPIFKLPYNVTLTKIRGTILGGSSVVFTIEKRSSTGLNSSGTAMPNSTITATQAGAETTTFSTATASAGDHLTLVTSTKNGTVLWLEIYIEFTIDRT